MRCTAAAGLITAGTAGESATAGHHTLVLVPLLPLLLNSLK